MCVEKLKPIFNIFLTLLFKGYKEEYTEQFVLYLKNSFKIVFWIFIFINVLNYIGSKIYNYKNSQRQKKELENLDENCANNELYKALYSYFDNKENHSPILIDGEWGAGKTYAIEEFLNHYYKYKNKKIYRISCFGITTREQLIELVKDVCEKEDDGLYKEIIDLISKIPIIGEFLKNIFGPKYDLNSIKENSIFIFDDFERVEPFSKDINKEDNNYNLQILAKYNIINGFIDSLMETYNMKVVILVNIDKLVDGYFYENFVEKLAVKMYKINSKTVSFSSVWKDSISSIIMDSELNEKLNNIYENVKEAAELIWKNGNCENIRVLRKTIFNYIDFIKYLMDSNYTFDKENNEEIGIFLTCIIEGIFDEEKWNVLEKYFHNIKIGENISTYFDKNIINNNFGNENDFVNYFRKINTIWYSSNSLRNYWKNLEDNHKILPIKMEKLNIESKKVLCLNKFNYNEINVKEIECVYWSDLAYIINIKKDSAIKKAIELIKNKKVNFYSNNENMYINIEKEDSSINLNYIFETIKTYGIEKIIIKNYELFLALFRYIENELGNDINKQESDLSANIKELYLELKNAYNDIKDIF